MSTETEQLAKAIGLVIDALSYVQNTVGYSSEGASRLREAKLALGAITVPPPEPPALVTNDMAQEWLCRTGDDSYASNLRMLNDLCASAIRLAVERKTDADHVRLDVDGEHCTYIQHVSVRSILAIFGLDGGAS